MKVTRGTKAFAACGAAAHGAAAGVAALACALVLAAVLAVAGFAPACAFAVESTGNTATANQAGNTNSNTNANKNANDNLNLNMSYLDLGEENFVDPQQQPDSSFIYDTTITDLATADTYLEGQTVQVVGEVVGDRVQAEMDFDHMWLVLADADSTTISCYMDTKYASLVDTFGRYGQTGTQLQVRGAFNLSCTEHQGQTDIHVTYASIFAKGSVNQVDVKPTDFLFGLVLVAIGLLMMGIFFVVRERSR
ncbi:MAG: hypothetical protein Q4E12_04660 [Coriobacteriia bacterium]|nr:hypothetical protein [Coriobacteriia bacterium]